MSVFVNFEALPFAVRKSLHFPQVFLRLLLCDFRSAYGNESLREDGSPNFVEGPVSWILREHGLQDLLASVHYSLRVPRTTGDDVVEEGAGFISSRSAPKVPSFVDCVHGGPSNTRGLEKEGTQGPPARFLRVPWANPSP